MSRPESPDLGSASVSAATAASASEGEECDAEAARRPRDDAASRQAARLLLSMQRESEVLRSFLRFDIADTEAAEVGGRSSPGPAAAARAFRRAAAAAVAVSPTGAAPAPADASKRVGSSAPASKRRPRSQPLPVPIEGGKKLSPFQQIMREIKMKRNAANSRASRSRRSRRVVQEEEYTDKDRAAAANMGSRDIKQSLKLKRKQERSRALQIPEEARPGALLALGSREMRRGNLRTAIGVVHKALELNPRDKNALVCRSKCHLLMGEPQLALQDAEAALRIDKNFVKVRCSVVRPSAIFQKAEALYNTGDFEHSLMFYHRGQRLRPELDAFRLGVQKTQQAIQNTIGQALTGPEARRALRCQSARRPSEEEASAGSGSSGGSTNHSTRPTSRSASGSGASCGRSRERERTRSPTGRRLLGELCVDKEYLEQLLRNPDINSLQPNGASIIATEAEEAVSFLKTRQEFWRQQYPISINASKLKRHRN